MPKTQFFRRILFMVILVYQSVPIFGQKLNTLSQQEINEGWKLLFDGKSHNGWHSYNKDSVTSNWKVLNECIVLDPMAKTDFTPDDLTTDHSYENFELHLEWKISEGGNSGVIFNVKECAEYKNSWFTGPEMQILDNINAFDNKKETHLAGMLYDICGTASLSKPKRPGEWNKAIIIQNKSHLYFFLNDLGTVDLQERGPLWTCLTGKSKFKNRKYFNHVQMGKIALQDHYSFVSFRNIKIKLL